MGICFSCYTGTIASKTTTTVKLILLDGQLNEFETPIKVFMVAQPLNSFICNANDMDFGKVVKSMSDEEELYPGHIYFELPLSWLNRQLAAEDMASLAVKAGKALMCSSGNKVMCGCCVSKVDPLVFCDEDEMMSSSWSGDGGSCAGGDAGNRGKGRVFTRLERIVEE
ncbi:hypothetical protein CTI12_AA034090 [Artemisia annua]|uniref:Uncharacterized protein n=1 Tax=Artemisia annua TaxID=35608 RepID=A0A2U1PZA2_ARTAN|nr:hypothetical protein CTI12_AA034090 [Artemisia annua]